MRSLVFLAAIAISLTACSIASAQCPNGVCPTARSHAVRPMRSVLVNPVAAVHRSVVVQQTRQVSRVGVGVGVYGDGMVGAGRHNRVERRQGRRAAVFGMFRLRGGC